MQLGCLRPRASAPRGKKLGALAQLGERLICIQEVIGSIPIGSTITKYLHDHQAHMLCLIILQGMKLTSYREKNIGIV